MKTTLDEEIKRISEAIDTEIEPEKEDFKPISEEEMGDFQTEIDEKNMELLPENQLEYEIPKTNKKKKRKKKNRTVDLHARFTPEEAEKIGRDRELTGMKPGEYMRHRMLEDVSFTVIDRDALAENTRELVFLKAEVGRIGGLIKSIIKPNEGNPHFTEEALGKIIDAVNDLNELKGQIQKAVNRKWPS